MAAVLFVEIWKTDWIRVHWVACPQQLPQTHSQSLHLMHRMRSYGNIWMAIHQCRLVSLFLIPRVPTTSPRDTFWTEGLSLQTKDPRWVICQLPRPHGSRPCMWAVPTGFAVRWPIGQLCEQQVSIHSVPPPPSPGRLLIFQVCFKCHLFGQAFLDILNSASPQL